MRFKEAENNTCQLCRAEKIMPRQRNPCVSLKICFHDYFPCFEADCNFPLHVPLFGIFVLHQHSRQELTPSTPSPWLPRCLFGLKPPGNPLVETSTHSSVLFCPSPLWSQPPAHNPCSPWDLDLVIFPSIFLPHLHCNP